MLVIVSGFLGKIEKSRQLWEKLIKNKRNGKDWRFWNAMIDWEMKFGFQKPVQISNRQQKQNVSNVNINMNDEINVSDLKDGLNNIYRIRFIYKRAITILTLDNDSGLQYMSEKYKQFESEIGDLKSINTCEKRIENRMKQEMERMAAQKRKQMKKSRAKDRYNQMNKVIQQQQQQHSQSFGMQNQTQTQHQNQIQYQNESQNQSQQQQTRQQQHQNSIVGKKRKFDESLDDVTVISGNTNVNDMPLDKRRKLNNAQNTTNNLSAPRDSAASATSAVTDTVVMTASHSNSETIDNDNENGSKNVNSNSNSNNNGNVKNVDEIGTKVERTVFVVNFRKSCKYEDLLSLMSNYGSVLKLTMPNSTKNKHLKKGYGYAIYSHKNEAFKAINQLNETLFQGKKLQVQRYKNKQTEENTVHLKGLKHLTKEKAKEYIRNLFDGCGNIVEIRLPVEKKSRENDEDIIKGFAYVQFDNLSSVNNALTLDKTKFGDRIIEVRQYSDTKQAEKESMKQQRGKAKGKGKGRGRGNRNKWNNNKEIEMNDDARFGIIDNSSNSVTVKENEKQKEKKINADGGVKPEERGNDYFSNLFN